MKWFLRLLLLAVLLAVALGAAAVYMISAPYKGFSTEKYITIPHGTSTRTIAQLLQGNGVVEHDWQFLLARLFSPGAKLQAGEYKFEKPASPLQVFTRIAKGDIFYFEVTIPEGQNMFDIAASIKNLGLFTEAQFLEAAHDASSIRDLDPEAHSLEGYLWPDTYRVVRTTTPAQLCANMTHKFRARWKSLNTTANVHNTITLASLVEREARAPQDRALISSVFHNRLEMGMKLDCDPTTVYAALLDHRYRGTIYRSDLLNPNPYNTYQNVGLPPGPIANPGLESIKAALAPAASKYLYFVVKPGTGGAHAFSETLAAHQAATANYRRAQNQ